MTRVAAIDCGTNSLRLLVADVDPSQKAPEAALRELVRRTEVVRLGEGVDARGEISADAMARALTVTREYAAVCADLGTERVRFVATSASRDARNADDFVAGVRACFPGVGVVPEVISGREEAELSFRGATVAMTAAGHVPDFLVVDLGGGSTEFVRGGCFADRALSVDIGCVRLTERHLRSDPPTPGEVAAVREQAAAALDRVADEVGLVGVCTLVGLAGSVTTLTAHALRLPSYTTDDVHLATLSVEETLAACADLVAMPRAGRAALPYMHPGRVDVIAAGAIVWASIVERVHAVSGIESVVTSVHDILDGIAIDLAAG